MEIVIDKFPHGDQVLLESLVATYVQESDCTESTDEDQEIIVSTRDGGGGKFFNIKTNSWSFSESNELIELINDFKKRIYG